MPEVGSLLMLFLDFKTLIVHLDNDSLLNGFRLYPRDLLCGVKDHHGRVVLGGEGSRERSWYRVMHTFADDGSTSYFRLDRHHTLILPPLYTWCASSRHADTFPTRLIGELSCSLQ